MGVYLVPTQCLTTTGFSSQIVRLPRTPAIPINSLLFGAALETAKLGWEIAFEIQIATNRECIKISTTGREGGKKF